jgi:hypothetical protein
MRIAVGTLSLLVGLIGLTACGSSFPPPNDEWSAAQADLGRAEGGGASNVPDAKAHLTVAREDLNTAKTLIDQDNRRAASLIALARTEAQLALSLAKAKEAEDQLAQAQKDLQKQKGGM